MHQGFGCVLEMEYLNLMLPQEMSQQQIVMSLFLIFKIKLRNPHVTSLTLHTSSSSLLTHLIPFALNLSHLVMPKTTLL